MMFCDAKKKASKCDDDAAAIVQKGRLKVWERIKRTKKMILVILGRKVKSLGENND